MNQFDAQSTTEQVIREISLRGKYAVVTGASSGLGLETCRVLAAAGAEVLMLARDADKLKSAEQNLREADPAARLRSLTMDLADLDSVRAKAAEIRTDYPQIHLLINNAGVMACPLARTAQGFEMQFGTNHLGHFLLTCLLAPALLAAAPGRVVTLSSAGHKFAPVNFEDPAYRERGYDKWQAYGESKTANVLFTVGLEARLGSAGVHAFAVHPGAIMTQLGRHMEEADYQVLMSRASATKPLAFKSVEQGAATSVWAATSPALEGRGGLYLENCHIAEPATSGADSGVESYAIDATDAERLWALSESLVGQSFEF